MTPNLRISFHWAKTKKLGKVHILRLRLKQKKQQNYFKIKKLNMIFQHAPAARRADFFLNFWHAGYTQT